jgi:hypothetical protein
MRAAADGWCAHLFHPSPRLSLSLQRGEEKDHDAILASLDKQYMDPEYDPVALLLGGLPEADSRTEAYLSEQKQKQQELLDAVSARLGREVVANYAAFIEGMRQISEIDMDVSRASIHVSNSLRKLGSAKESLVTGTLGIAYRRRRRERLAVARRHLGFMQSLVRVDDIVARACREHRYADAVRAVTSAQAQLREPGTGSFSVMKNLRVRLDSALDMLRTTLDSVLDGQCLSFKPAVYGALMMALRELDAAGLKAGSSRQEGAAERDRTGTVGGEDMLDGFEAGGAAAFPEGSSGDAEAGAGREAGQGLSLLEEVGSSIAAAAGAAGGLPGITSIAGIGGADSHLAALLGRVQRSANKAAKALTKEVIVDLLLTKLRAKMDAGGESPRTRSGDATETLRAIERAMAAGVDEGDDDAAKAAADYLRRRAELKQRSFTDLAASLPPEDVPAACMRAAAAVAHVMHQHYLLLQWHRSPFDARAGADEGEFLHRCTLEEVVDPDAEVAERDAGAHVKARGQEAASPLAATLLAMRPFLLRGRTTVWQHMQQRFGTMLFSAVGAAGVALPLERLCQCLILSRDLMAVGLEYVGHNAPRAEEGGPNGLIDVDPCSTMRGSLRLLCSQYIDAVSRDSFERMRGMLGKDDWQRVPLSSSDFLALLNTAQAGLRATFPKAALAAVEGATAAILYATHATGGPAKAAEGGLDDSMMDARGGDESTAARAYSDGFSLFLGWMDRGNPFGYVAAITAGKDGAQLMGATVLPVPRPHTASEDEEEEEDEEEDSGAGTPAAEAAAARKAYGRLMRRIHGNGYHLEIGLGRGPGLGFGMGIGGDNAVAVAAARGGDASDSDDDDDEDEVLEEDAESREDSDDEEHGERKRRGGEEEGFGAAGPYAAAFGGQPSHVVTAAALNGFAHALGKHVLLMEVLPTVASDAFIGLARVFELYLFTVATLFLRPNALKQLYDVAPPSPAFSEKERDPSSFDYVDGAAFTVAARVAAVAAEARQADHRASGAHRLLKRMGGGYGGGGSSILDEGRAGRGRAGRGVDGEAETVTLHGVSLHVRGLPALAQSQALSPDFYLSGAGAEAATVIGGGAYGHEGVYTTLRRALQQIGSDLAGGVASRTGAAKSSTLASGVFTSDASHSQRGTYPEAYVRLRAGVELDGEAAAFGAAERCVAVESLDFMLDVLSRVRTRIESHLPAAHVASLSNFFTRAVQCSTQLRGLMYASLVVRLVPESGAIPNQITGANLPPGVAAVKWCVCPRSVFPRTAPPSNPRPPTHPIPQGRRARRDGEQ